MNSVMKNEVYSPYQTGGHRISDPSSPIWCKFKVNCRPRSKNTSEGFKTWQPSNGGIGLMPCGCWISRGRKTTSSTRVSGCWATSLTTCMSGLKWWPSGSSSLGARMRCTWRRWWVWKFINSANCLTRRAAAWASLLQHQGFGDLAGRQPFMVMVFTIRMMIASK